eukprot:63003_1
MSVRWTTQQKQNLMELRRRGKTYEEIAMVMGRTKNSVKSMYERLERAQSNSRNNNQWNNQFLKTNTPIAKTITKSSNNSTDKSSDTLLDADNDYDMKLKESPITTKMKPAVIKDIKWTDNGKIMLSFVFNPNYRQTILSYQLYYCYVNENDPNWYKYASNNWKSIHIASKEYNNKDIELRIATCIDIYDENKNKNIELIMKIRNEFKLTNWRCHTFWSEFSVIYF